LIGGLLLALVSAALINLGFLLQHRGLGSVRGTWLKAFRDSLRNGTWLTGQAIGWFGFALQTLAVAIAPLSLVQAFAAGGLALSVPLAACLFGHRISRRQTVAVLCVALALAVLPIGLSTGHDHLHPGRLVLTASIWGVIALGFAATRSASALAIAAGAFYGIADASIKAVSVNWRVHGLVAIVSGWTVLAAVATFAGFLAFQAALRADGAVGAISLMNALAAMVALACGLLAFGESLGRSTGAVIVHLVAIAAVLGCVPTLAAAQDRMAVPGGRRRHQRRSPRSGLTARERTG
jgi:hypothetical protein